MSMVVSPAMSNPSDNTERTMRASPISIETTTAFAFAPCLTSKNLGPRHKGHRRSQPNVDASGIDRGGSPTRPPAT
jgi:hypothetical protein